MRLWVAVVNCYVGGLDCKAPLVLQAIKIVVGRLLYVGDGHGVKVGATQQPAQLSGEIFGG